MSINYDRRTEKVLKCVALLALGLSVVIFGLMPALFMVMKQNMSNYFVIMLYGLYLVAIPGLFAGIMWMDCKMYFARLKKYGYIIPERKRDYGNRLENVPRQMPLDETGQPLDLGAKDSKKLGLIYLVIFGVILAEHMVYLVKWIPLDPEGSLFVLIFTLVPNLFWPIAAMLFFRQQNSEKYADDVAFHPYKKRRMSLGKGILLAIIMACLVLFWTFGIRMLSEVIYRSNLIEQQQEMEQQQSLYNDEGFDID